MLARAVTLALALAFVGSALAQVRHAHRVLPDTTQIELLTSSSVLDDPSGQLTPEDVEAAAARGEMRAWARQQFSYFSAGTQRAMWFRFEVAADASRPDGWLIEVSRPYLRRVRLFTRSPEGIWTSSPEVGDSLPFSARPVAHRNFVFPTPLPQGTTLFLLRVQSDVPTQVLATLWQRAAFDAHDTAFFSFSWFYFGVLGAMLVYNLLLYVMVRDLGYLLLVGYIETAGVAYLANSGLATQFVLGDLTWWSERFLLMIWGIGAYFRSELTRHFLSTRSRLPTADKALWAFAWGGLATTVAAAFLPRVVPGVLVFVTGIGGSLLIDGVSVVAMIRRWPGAGYYCASWMVVSVAVFVVFARFFGLVPADLVPATMLPSSSALGFVLLSLALAHQINEEKRQKEEARARSLAIMQASQAIGSETRLDQLHSRVREVMAALTHATAVRFVLRDPDMRAWFLYDAEAGGRLSAEEAGARGLLPLSALRHVETTQEALVVDDAVRDARFASDPAFSRAQQCSLMVLPVVQKGEMRAVLMLEDTGSSGAFSHAEIDTLVSIAGPLAVALENVLLYERLEQRVEEKTSELRETQQELMATARRAGMAEIATNVLHNVGNILNSVNVAADLIRTRVVDSRVSGLAKAVDLLDAHKADLSGFLQDDPKGRLLADYLRQLSGALAREREELLGRVAELVANVDHIKGVVATQQTYAGSSTFTERVLPSDVVADALRMTDDSLRHHRVEVVKDLPDIAAVKLDKTRTLQILVNLISNATHAMVDVHDRPRELRVELAAADRTLCFRVQDAGCGIAPENMARIFSYGFTTREGGHGFGLHSCALAASQMGGSLTAQSDGLGRGATFTLTLPFTPA